MNRDNWGGNGKGREGGSAFFFVDCDCAPKRGVVKQARVAKPGVARPWLGKPACRAAGWWPCSGFARCVDKKAVQHPGEACAFDFKSAPTALRPTKNMEEKCTSQPTCHCDTGKEQQRRKSIFATRIGKLQLSRNGGIYKCSFLSPLGIGHVHLQHPGSGMSRAVTVHYNPGYGQRCMIARWKGLFEFKKPGLREPR